MLKNFILEIRAGIEPALISFADLSQSQHWVSYQVAVFPACQPSFSSLL